MKDGWENRKQKKGRGRERNLEEKRMDEGGMWKKMRMRKWRKKEEKYS